MSARAVSSTWVWREVKLALDRTIAEPTYPLLPILAEGTRLEDLPSFLSQFQCFADAGIREAAFGKLLAGVLGKGPRVELARVSEPFVGLRAFDSTKAHLFFGREQKVAELVELLRTEHLVMVVGDSGAGKSSLVKAGLVPAFRGGRLARSRDQGPDESIWHVVETRPGTSPFVRLADDLREAAQRVGISPRDASEIADLVRTKKPDKLRDAMLSAAPRDPQRPVRTLLVMDQFEEFRTSADAADYVAGLLRLADPGDDRVRVVLTMRRDYYFACKSFPELYERLEASERRCRPLLSRMSREELRAAAVIEPLKLAGVTERDAADLADAVVRDAGDEPGELALLQMALWRTWARPMTTATTCCRPMARLAGWRVPLPRRRRTSSPLSRPTIGIGPRPCSCASSVPARRVG